jgi:hypothetical protein
MANLQTIGPEVKAGPLNNNFAALNSAKVEKSDATSAATPNTIVQRDSAGRFKAAAPSASDDVARKAEVDAVQAEMDTKATVVSNKVNVSGAWAGLRANASSGTSAELEFLIAGVRSGFIISSAAEMDLRKYASDGTTIESRIRLQPDRIVLSGMDVIRSQSSPEGNITASPGSICSVWSGAETVGLWVKMSGTGNTGWMKVATI